MRFTIASALSMAAAASAAMSASQITAEINTLAQMLSDANEVAKSISPENVHRTVPELISDLNEITAASTNLTTAMDARKHSPQARQVVHEPVSTGKFLQGFLRGIESQPVRTLHTLTNSLGRRDCQDGESQNGCESGLAEVNGPNSEPLDGKKMKRQGCLDAEDPRQCLDAVRQRPTVDDDFQVGRAKLLRSKRNRMKKRQAQTGDTEAERKGICDAITIYQDARQQLIHTLLGENSILSSPSFEKPRAVVDRSLRAAFGTIEGSIAPDFVNFCRPMLGLLGIMRESVEEFLIGAIIENLS
ncbi:hypothetical protein BDV18DRAFT_155438 [Aspergillus unguis]